MKIVLSGGGTLGPVTPLLAVREAVLQKYSEAKFIWVGTKNGPEREVVEKAGLPFFMIAAGKWRRYYSALNVVDLFKFTVGFCQSLWLLWRFKPAAIISAGGFVSVPLHLAAAWLRIPAWVHQQDIVPGLANRLMFPLAKIVTTALKETAAALPPKYNPRWLGNPVRNFKTIDSARARSRLKLKPDQPVIFALGGGTGSASINQLILTALSRWSEAWQVVHLVGRGRARELFEGAARVFPNYQTHQFFTNEMGDAYAAADVVIARAGFGTLSELAYFKKSAIILPLPDTHQEDNAKYFAERGGIIMLTEDYDNGLKLAQLVRELIEQPERARALGERLSVLLPRAEPDKIVAVVEELVKQ